MKEKQPLSERVLLAICVSLGAAIVALAFCLAIRPHWLDKGIAPRPIKYSPSTNDVLLEDFSTSNFGSEFSTGEMIYLPTMPVPDRRDPLGYDDEKTSGNTNIDVLKRRNIVTVPALDLMDLTPLLPSVHEELYVPTEVAPVSSVTPTDGR